MELLGKKEVFCKANLNQTPEINLEQHILHATGGVAWRQSEE